MSKFPLYSAASLPNGRWTILRDAGPDCPELEIHTFLHNFLPRVPEIDNVQVDSIVGYIKQHTRSYARGRWKAFPKDPRLSEDNEDTIFRGFDKVIATIQKAAEHCVSGLEPKTRYISLFPDTASVSHPNQHNTTRPSGCFVFLNDRLGYGDIPHWMDIAVSGEFKKYESDRHIYDNVEKALWNMHHTLRDDPRRRFAFAFTIEDVNMRIWFCNRAEIVVSEPFNFITEMKPLVQFVLAFLYAPEAAMGLDENMTCIWDGQETTVPQYLITVRSADHPDAVKRYRTIRLISAVGAEAIRDRGTRMWEVKEVKNGKMVGKSMMLKDSWIDSDRPCEDAVIKKIFEDAKRFENPEDRDLLHQSFLEPIIAGDVWVGSDVDITVDRRTGANNRPSKFNLVRPPVTYNTDSSASSSIEATPSPVRPFSDGQTRTPAVHHSKTHYRIVFDEVCEVLHELTSLPDILYTLCKVSEVLRLFHKLGWVHRNLSSGNIMLVGDVVKISDLEHSTKMDEVGDDRNIRTGTEDFMAIEASLQRYSFRPEAKTERTTGITAEEIRRVLTRNKRMIEGVPGTHSTMPKRYTWSHNPIHDMESIYWLLLYFLCNTDVQAVPMDKPRVKVRDVFSFTQESPAERGMRILHHRRFAHELFGNRVRRVEVVLSGDLLAEHLRDHPLHPSIAPLDGSLLEIRRALVTRYCKVERNPSKIDATCADGLHEEFLANIYAMMAHVESTVHQITVRFLSEAWASLPQAERNWLEDGADENLGCSRGHAALVSAGSKRSYDDIDASDEEDGHDENSEGEEEEPSPARPRRMVSRAHGSASKAPERMARTRRLSPTNRLAAVARHQRTEIPASTRVLRSTLRKQFNSAGLHSQSMSPARAQANMGGGRQVKARACR